MEIRRVIGAGSRYVFRFASEGKPVLAFEAPQAADQRFRGVLELNGALVALDGHPGDGAVTLAAGDIRTTLTSITARRELAAAPAGSEAKLLLEVRDSLRVGYLGYYTCSGLLGDEAG